MHRATREQGKDQACGDRRQAGRSKLYLCGEDGGLESGFGNWGPVGTRVLVSEWGDRDGGTSMLLGGNSIGRYCYAADLFASCCELQFVLRATALSWESAGLPKVLL